MFNTDFPFPFQDHFDMCLTLLLSFFWLVNVFLTYGPLQVSVLKIQMISAGAFLYVSFQTPRRSQMKKAALRSSSRQTATMTPAML